MVSIEIIEGLYINPGMKFDQHEIKKKSSPCGQIYLNVYMFRNDIKFISG